MQDLENNPDNFDPQNNSNPLTRNQKLAVGGLSVLALFTVIFWGLQFRSNIQTPFSYDASGLEEVESATVKCTGLYCSADGQEDLRFKDTDNDGLSDWDELNVYSTSPYLEDTDSDGLSDYGEVMVHGTDPNCPEGKDCFGYSGVVDDSATSSETEGIDYYNTTNTSGVATTEAMQDLLGVSEEDATASAETEDLTKFLSGQADAKMLRQILVSSGFDEETLNQISDDDLVASYLETISSVNLAQ